MEGMKKSLLASCAVAVCIAAAGCSSPNRVAMGAGACDLSLDVAGEHRCAVSRVTPVNEQSQLTNGMRTFEGQIRSGEGSVVPASQFRFPR